MTEQQPTDHPPGVYETLDERGMIAQCSDPEMPARLAAEKVTVYVGFDPTADSLHLGHMVPIMALAHFQRAGHRSIALVGGATGMIGDPSGRSDERNLLGLEAIRHNVECLKTQLGRFLDYEGENAALMLNNYDWISKMSFIDWLRDVGKNFSIGYMLGKESVRRRIGAGREGDAVAVSDEGISFTEFSYMTMQAYDYLHLFDAHGCTLQAGGSDQWGNITAGMDLIRKTRGEHVGGVTLPLVTTASGEKFGKSAGNAVWLDPARTSPYQFYQYWINADDRDVEGYLKFFTFLSVDEIDSICADHAAAPEKRAAQHRLAEEVTRGVHGEAELAKAIKASAALFSGDIAGLSADDLEQVFAEAPSYEVARGEFGEQMAVVDLMAHTGICKSRGEARRLVKGGGVYLNGERVADAGDAARAEKLIDGTTLVIRVGKKKYHLVRVGGG